MSPRNADPPPCATIAFAASPVNAWTTNRFVELLSGLLLKLGLNVTSRDTPPDWKILLISV